VAEQIYAPTVRKRLRASAPLRYAIWSIEALFAGLLWGLLACLSPDRASQIGRACLRAIGSHFQKSRRVRANLAIAFPEKSREEIESLTRDVWGNFGALLAEFPHLRTICEEAEQRIEIVVKGAPRVLAEPDRPAIFVTAHLANLDLPAFACARLGAPLVVLYSPNDNPLIEWMLKRFRRVLRCTLVPRDGGVRPAIRALESGRSLGLFVDTRIDVGERVLFFGRCAATTTVPARLALRFGCELIPARLERLAGARFRFTLY
jgi:Kdo2-lipid IVA lauroyltransferase/acyltransferase